MVGFWPPTQCVSIDHSLFPILPNPFLLLSWSMLAGDICRCTLTSTWFQIHVPRTSLECRKSFYAVACWKLAGMVPSDCNGQWSLWWLALDSCLLSTPSLPPIHLTQSPLSSASFPKTPTLCIINRTSCIVFMKIQRNPPNSHSHYFLLATEGRKKQNVHFAGLPTAAAPDTSQHF